MAERRRFRGAVGPVVLVGLALGVASPCPAGDGWAEAAPRGAIVEDWLRQDAGGEAAACFTSADGAERESGLVGRVLAELAGAGRAAEAERAGAAAAGALEVERAAVGALEAERAALAAARVAGRDPRWRALYEKACGLRREARLRTLAAKFPQVIYTKHYDIGGSHYAYTEGQSDAQAERHFKAGSALCLMEIEGVEARARTLIDEPRGVIRDPDVSYDGRRVLFAWKKSDREDDYHLYELDAAGGEVRQLTFGLGFADYEGAYLPDGDILFNSTRCVQIVDCWWTEVSNLYACDPSGAYLRRLGFDQVHTNYPQVLDDGRVIYTRWDYNDRGQIYPQPLFVMNPDGTGQTEFYGNNSWFPTTILHARGIPGTGKLVAVLSGHHSHQRGKLALIDVSRGRQEAEGVTLIAPVRETPAVRVDAYGQDGEQWQYPYPISETEFLVTYHPGPGGNRKYAGPFGIYWMDVDGRRELLAWDARISCNQPVPLAARRRPHLRPSVVDYRKDTGTYFVRDVYAGPGLAGVERGTVRRLRVVALEFRAAGIGSNGSNGPAGGALASTPVSCRNGTWDVKRVLGSATVHADGSALFTVPARTPVYFQLLDAKDRVVQSMRSWSTLQPGETFACVGCHESKAETAGPEGGISEALRRRPQALEPFHGPARGFSFAREVQPILDRHCVRCHNDRSKTLVAGEADGGAPPAAGPRVPADGTGAAAAPAPGGEGAKKAFSLLDERSLDKAAKRMWSDSYLALTQNGKPNRVVNWLNVQSIPPMLPPYFAGSARSRLMTMLEEGHNGVRLSAAEREKIACWIDLLVPFCGDYVEANAWTDAEKAKYAHFQAKRDRMEAVERENVRAWAARQTGQAAAPASPGAAAAPEGGTVRRRECICACADGATR